MARRPAAVCIMYSISASSHAARQQSGPARAPCIHRTSGRCYRTRRTMTPYTRAEKFESFERINSIRETNGNFDSCNSCKRLVPSRLHELHESKFPFVSCIEFIRSKLSIFSAHVYGVYETTCSSDGWRQSPSPLRCCCASCALRGGRAANNLAYLTNYLNSRITRKRAGPGRSSTEIIGLRQRALWDRLSNYPAGRQRKVGAFSPHLLVNRWLTSDNDPGYMNRQIRKFRRTNSMCERSRSFDSCNSRKRMAPGRYFLSNFSAHVSGVNVRRQLAVPPPPPCALPGAVAQGAGDGRIHHHGHSVLSTCSTET